MFMHKNVLRLFQQSQLVFFTLTTLIGLATPTNATNSRNCGIGVETSDSYARIVGGTEALPGEFPWMVSLREFVDEVGWKHAGGAAILNENWIVTAAHVLDYPSADRYEILTGLHKLSKGKDPTVKRYKISKIVEHNKYDDYSFKNDIALLKTKKPIDILGSKGYINKICLPTSKQDPTGYATVIGWGHIKEYGRNSDVLKKALIPVISRRACKVAYDDDLDKISETMICAGMTGVDACQYDSGGPMFQTDENGVSTLIGIVSHGAGCGYERFPGVYTKISMFQNWINEVID